MHKIPRPPAGFASPGPAPGPPPEPPPLRQPDRPAARRLQARPGGAARGREPLTSSEDARTRGPDQLLRSATATSGGVRRDRGGAALPARGRGGRSTRKLGATNRGRGVHRLAFRGDSGARQPPAATSLVVRPDKLSLGAREYAFPKSPARHPPAAAAPARRPPRLPAPVPRPFRIPRPRAERQRWNLTRVGRDPPWFWGPLAPVAASPRLLDLAKGTWPG